jgi:hypothetical protein
VANPKDLKDPSSIPVLTDVIKPGRPSAGSRTEPEAKSEAAPAAMPEAPEASRKPDPELQAPVSPSSALGRSSHASASEAVGGAGEHDAERIAERVRARFSSYLREEGRGVVEARCREALEEHTNWLVRQVTREVTLALEAEVGRWVHDAVREALAARVSSKR